jgi:PilZ domain
MDWSFCFGVSFRGTAGDISEACLRKYLRVTPIVRSMSESRAAHRHRVLKAGAIEFSGGGAISCAVKNLSASGAALEVVSALDIPDRLILCIPAEHFRRHCHVVWRNEKRIGVAFE